MRATVVSDASYCDKKGVGGWAVWVRLDGYPLPIKGYGTMRERPRNSTEAEVQAALNGVYIAANRGATEILVRSDCQTVMQLINKSKCQPYLQSCWDKALASGWAQGVRNISGRHVKAHGKRDRNAAAWTNDWCDKHAKHAMRVGRRNRSIRKIGEDIK